jgi:hypothetical protein
MPLILFLLIATLGGIFYHSEVTLKADSASFSAESDVRVTNMLIYRNAVIAYAEANPSYAGVAADSALALPSWYRKMHGVNNYVVSGKGYVFAQGRAELSNQLYQKTKTINVGINKNGVLMSPVAGNTGIALPSAIPLDAVVLAP